MNQLVKFRSIHFQRIEADTFIVQLKDSKDNVVFTLEPREIMEDEQYSVYFSNDNVVMREKLPDL